MQSQSIYRLGSAVAVQSTKWGVAADSTVIPGQNNQPVPPGTVRPPAQGWSPNPSRKCR